jgi:hypothetical protein
MTMSRLSVSGHLWSLVGGFGILLETWMPCLDGCYVADDDTFR